MVFHIRITKQKNQEQLKWKNWTTSSDRIKWTNSIISKKDKQEKGKSTKDSTQRRTKGMFIEQD